MMMVPAYTWEGSWSWMIGTKGIEERKNTYSSTAAARPQTALPNAAAPSSPRPAAGAGGTIFGSG